MRHRFIRTLATLPALFAALSAGCTGVEDNTSVVLPVYTGGPNLDAALGGGTLVRDGRCLYWDDQGRRIMVAWPKDLTHWDEDTETLTFYDRTYALGDKIEVGGSGRPRGELRVDLATDPDQSCAYDYIFLAGQP